MRKERWVGAVNGKEKEELRNLEIEEPLVGIIVRAKRPKDSNQSRVKTCRASWKKLGGKRTGKCLLGSVKRLLDVEGPFLVK